MFSKKRSRDERGFALAVAVGVAFVVVLLSISALNQSVNTITQSGIANRQVNSVDAAEAGLQYEINQIERGAQANPAAAACPTSRTAMTGATASGGVGYDVAVTTSTSGVPPAPGSLDCSSSSITLAGVSDVLVQSYGSTATGSLGTRTLRALLTIAPPTTTYGPSTSFNRAIYANTGLSTSAGGGNVQINDSGAQANVYTGGPLTCSSTSIYQGDVYAYGGLTNGSGACAVSGSLYLIGTANLSGTYAKNMSVVGNLTIGSGTEIGGNIYATGSVEYAGNAVKSLYVDGSVKVDGGTTVSNVYATGNIDISNGRVTGNVESSAGSITYESGSTSGHAYVSSGKTIATGGSGSPGKACPTSGSSATACSFGAMPSDFPASSVFPTAATLPAQPAFPSLTYDANAWKAAGYTRFDTNVTDCNGPNSSQQFDANSVAADLASMEQPGAPPTVITTPCQVTWSSSNYPETSTISLYNNLAIFAAGGFDFPAGFAGFTVGGSSVPNPNLFLIVPSNFASQQSQSTTCPGDTSTGDISLNSSPSDGGSSASEVRSFLYTPGNVCGGNNNPNVVGKVYAGQQFSIPSGSYSQTWYDLNPFTASSGSGSGSTTTGGATVAWIRQSS